MSYQSTVEQLYALGHELASTPSHKFDLAYVRAMLEALGHPERRFCQRAHRGDERQRLDRGDAIVHPARRRIQERALQLAPPGAHQRTGSGKWGGHQRR